MVNRALTLLSSAKYHTNRGMLKEHVIQHSTSYPRSCTLVQRQHLALHDNYSGLQQLRLFGMPTEVIREVFHHLVQAQFSTIISAEKMGIQGIKYKQGDIGKGTSPQL